MYDYRVKFPARELDFKLQSKEPLKVGAYLEIEDRKYLVYSRVHSISVKSESVNEVTLYLEEQY